MIVVQRLHDFAFRLTRLRLRHEPEVPEADRKQQVERRRLARCENEPESEHDGYDRIHDHESTELDRTSPLPLADMRTPVADQSGLVVGRASAAASYCGV